MNTGKMCGIKVTSRVYKTLVERVGFYLRRLLMDQHKIDEALEVFRKGRVVIVFPESQSLIQEFVDAGITLRNAYWEKCEALKKEHDDHMQNLESISQKWDTELNNMRHARDRQTKRADHEKALRELVKRQYIELRDWVGGRGENTPDMLARHAREQGALCRE
jgi:hypothetical protein